MPNRSLAHINPLLAPAGFSCVRIRPRGKSSQAASDLCRRISTEQQPLPFLVGVAHNAWTIRELALELAALRRVGVTAAALEGDQVARRELAGRVAAVEQRVKQLLEMLEAATWYRNGEEQKLRSAADMSRLASGLADATFHWAPVLRNELVNRSKPSSNAVAAANSLMRMMVESGLKENLGIEGFPPERAIYASILKASGMHRRRQRQSGRLQI